MGWLSILIAVAALVHIGVDALGWQRLTWITKPLPMLGLFIRLLSAAHFGAETTHFLIAGGLACSLLGDLFLLRPQRYFGAGLASFLLAHLLYTGGFYLAGGRLTYWPLLVLGPLLLGYLALLWRFLAGFKLPVLGYVFAIAAMAVSASSWFYFYPSLPAFYAAVGGILFVISDSCLGWQKFRGDYPLSTLCIMATYYGAQWLIVLSMVA